MDKVFIRASNLHLHRNAILKGVFRQELATERMYRADRDLVKVWRQAIRLFEHAANTVLELARRLLCVRHKQQVLHALYLLLNQ